MRVILGFWNKRADAEKEYVKCIGKARNPRLVQSEKTGRWLIVLYESESESDIDKAYGYFIKKGLAVVVQL